MDKERKLLIAGNWKMNKTVAEAIDLVDGLVRELANVKEVDIVVCPPFTALHAVSKKVLDTQVRLGAQTMNENGYGAFTGEVNAGMLKEFSVRYVILGHSERRQYYAETNALIAKKALAAHAAALKPIVCVGETHLLAKKFAQSDGHRGQRHRGLTLALGATQVSGKNNLCAILNKMFQRGQSRTYPSVVGNNHHSTLLFQRYVIIHTHKHLLAVCLQIFQRKFCHILFQGVSAPQADSFYSKQHIKVKGC